MSGIVIIATGVAILAGVFISNQVLESMASERIVLRELVRAFETDLRLQAVMLVVLAAALPYLRARVRGDQLKA
jgi:hypothetical protein